MTGATMHLVQMSVDMPTVARFYRHFWGKTSIAMSDERFLIKTTMTEMFPGVSPRPWRIQRFDPNGETMVLGYTTAGQERMREMASDALPELASAIPPESVIARPIRLFREGERLQVHATWCAAARCGGYERKRREEDAYDIELEAARYGERQARTREEVYRDMFLRPLSSIGSVSGVTLTGWRKSVFARKDADGIPRKKSNEFPVVDAIAELSVEHPLVLADLMATGFGRNKAYGYGMLLIRPSA